MAENNLNIKINGLHNSINFNIKFDDNNILILVGENGTGKSTVASMLYYFLSRQWNRLAEYQFYSIEAQIGSEHAILSNRELKLFPTRAFRNYPQRLRHVIDEILLKYSPESLLNRKDLLLRVAHLYDIPAPILSDFIYSYFTNRYTREEENKESEDAKRKKSLITSMISKFLPGQILFLPTYRRIEHDLKSIFRGMEDDIQRFKNNLRKRSHGETYVEFVEFGMEDVEATIISRMNNLKDNMRTGLNDLTGSYLREVIKGEHINVDVNKLKEDIDKATVESMFDRIGESILPKYEQDDLKSKIDEIFQKISIDDKDKVIAHFLSKILILYENQKKAENDVRNFVKVCNEYLTGKQIYYDDTNYEIFIEIDKEQKLEFPNYVNPFESDNFSSNEGRLELHMLSSGEKQIVSLFSHIYMSGVDKLFLIIDEPELSLSVKWQRRFLPDIIASKKCSGLLAVTHSPYIWDNELLESTRSIEEFMG